MTQFHRYVEVITGDININNEALTIHFDIPFDNDTEPNESEINVYNLTDDTIHRFKTKQRLVINAGYKNAVGEVLVGRISKVRTKYEGADKRTTIHVLDSADLDEIQLEEKAYRKNIKGAQIINDLAPKLNLPTVINLPKNKTYAEGYTADGEVQEVLKEVAADCGAVSYINRGTLYIQPLDSGSDEEFLVKPDNGLIGSPDPFEEEEVEGYKVKMLLRHRITTASLIKLESRQVKGKFRVRSGSHKCDDASFYTEVEVV